MLVVEHRQQVLKRLPLKGLHGGTLALDDYVALMRQQVRLRQDVGRRISRRGWRAA